MMNQKKAILIAVLVALFVILVAGFLSSKSRTATEQEGPLPDLREKEKTVALTNEDHILGSPNALLFLVVYTDFHCPFCEEYHQTLRNIMDVYGTSGEVAVVYRHMPLVQLHPHSPTYHLASECVYADAGDVAFWAFADLVFPHPDTKSVASSTVLTALATEAGADPGTFRTCMQEETYKQKVEDSFHDGWDIGIRSTPYTVLVTPYQEIVLDEIRSFKTIAASIETILRNLRNDPRLQNERAEVL
jgi:protein-disulfide isomerase